MPVKRETLGKSELGDFLDRKLYPAVSRSALFAELEPIDKGSYYLVHCPRCNFRESYVYKTGMVLKCKRINKCGHSVSLLAHINGGASPRSNDEMLDAVRKLASLGKVNLPKRGFRPEDVERVRKHEARQGVLETLLAVGQRTLWSAGPGEAARAYLRDARGFSDDEVQSLGMGLYPSTDEVREALLADGHQQEIIDESSCLAPEWPGYVLLPWTDEHGRPATLNGRWPEVNPPADRIKILSLPASDMMRSFPLCFNLALNAGQRELVLVQGIFDAFLLQVRGETRAISCGGDQITVPQAETLARQKVRSVTLCFEPEKGGDRAILHSADHLRRAGITVYVAPRLPDGVDPDDVVRKRGIDVWRDYMNKAVSETVFRGLQLVGAVKPKSGDAPRREAVERVLEYCSGLRGEWRNFDQGDLLRFTAERTGYPIEELLALAERYSVQKRLHQILREGISEIEAPHVDLFDTAHRLSEELASLQTSMDEPPAFSVDRLDRETVQRPVGKTSGWKSLDALDIRFNHSELSVVAARNGHCKTAFLTGLLANWLRQDDSEDEMFLLFSLDEPEVQLYHRLLSLLTTLDSGEGWTAAEVGDYLRDPSMRGSDYRWPETKLLASAREKLRSIEGKLRIIFRPGWTIREMTSYVRTLKDRAPLGGILVDHVQRIRVPDGNARDSVSKVCHQLKQLATDLNCPVVATCDLPQDTVSADLKARVARVERYKESLNLLRSARPALDDVRVDGVEREADFVLGLMNYAAEYRSNTERPTDIPDTTLFEVGTLKNPYGPSGSWGTLHLVGKYGLIRDPAY